MEDKFTILAIDDYPAPLYFLKQILSSVPYRLKMTTENEAELSLLEQGTTCLVLLDLRMPRRGGGILRDIPPSTWR